MAIKLWAIYSNPFYLVLGSIREVFYADFSPTFEVEEDYWGGYIVNRGNCKIVLDTYHLRIE